MFPVQVTASNGSQSVTTVVTLNIVPPSPATLLTPANGGMLTGGKATTFTWTAGYGVTQYQLSIGTTPGGSDIASVATGATRSQIEEAPCIEASRVYVTLSSMINGAWVNVSYEDPWCDCGGGGTGGGGGGSGGAPSQPTLQLISSEPNVLNNGQQQTGTYYIYDATTGDALPASGIDPGSLYAGSYISATISNYYSDNVGLFDVTFTAVSPAAPGQRTLNLTWIDYPSPLTLSNSVNVYDASPVITSVIPSAIPAGQTSTIIISGLNFGQQQGSGSVATCAAGSTPCNGTPDITLTVVSWGDQLITAIASASPTATGPYDVQLTSGGEDPADGFVQAPQSGSSAQSNRGRVTVPKIVVTSSATQISQNATGVSATTCASGTIAQNTTVCIDGTPTGPTIIASVPGAPVGDTATFTLTVTFNQVMRDCTVVPQLQGFPIGPQQPQPASQQYSFGPVSFGGTAAINWTYYPGGTGPGIVQPPFFFNILAQNPIATAGSALDNALNSVMINAKPLWFAKNVAIHETNESQFYVAGYSDSSSSCGQINQTPGAPYYGFPGGYGILQHAPPTSTGELWNWQTAISQWQTQLVQVFAGSESGSVNGTSSAAYPFWIRQVLRWQQLYNGMPAWTTDPSQSQYSGCTFSAPDPNPNDPPTRSLIAPYWYADAILMKDLLVGTGGSPYVQLNDSNPNNVQWQFNKATAGGSPDIVKGFCSCGPGGYGRSSCLSGY